MFTIEQREDGIFYVMGTTRVSKLAPNGRYVAAWTADQAKAEAYADLRNREAANV